MIFEFSEWLCAVSSVLLWFRQKHKHHYSDILDVPMLIKSRILTDYAKLSQAMLDKISKKSLNGIHGP